MAWDYQFKSSGEVDGTQGFREIITEYIDFSGGGGKHLRKCEENLWAEKRCTQRKERGWEKSLEGKTSGLSSM